jgi:hypothetical protein
VADDPGALLLRWFKELIKNKMSALAIPVVGISVSLTILTFSKLFEFPIGPVIAWAGAALLLFMIGLLGMAAYVLVTRNLEDSPKNPPERRPKGKALPKGADTPMQELSKRKPHDAAPQDRSVDQDGEDRT